MRATSLHLDPLVGGFFPGTVGRVGGVCVEVTEETQMKDVMASVPVTPGPGRVAGKV